jgi:hypothetical protein
MDIGALFLVIGVVIIIALFVSRPFTEHWQTKVESSHDVSALLAEREQALNALIELDLDNGIGKIPAEEYTAQRARLVQKGSDILRRLDEARKKMPSSFPDHEIAPVFVQQTAVPSDDELESLIAKRHAMLQQKSAGFCSNCGKPIFQTDQYCPSCGQILKDN